jgi:hypothetical protein
LERQFGFSGLEAMLFHLVIDWLLLWWLDELQGMGLLEAHILLKVNLVAHASPRILRRPEYRQPAFLAMHLEGERLCLLSWISHVIIVSGGELTIAQRRQGDGGPNSTQPHDEALLTTQNMYKKWKRKVATKWRNPNDVLQWCGLLGRSAGTTTLCLVACKITLLLCRGFLEYLKRGTQGFYIHLSLLTVHSYRWQSDLTVSLLQIHDSRRLGKEWGIH